MFYLAHAITVVVFSYLTVRCSKEAITPTEIACVDSQLSGNALHGLSNHWIHHGSASRECFHLLLRINCLFFRTSLLTHKHVMRWGGGKCLAPSLNDVIMPSTSKSTHEDLQTHLAWSYSSGSRVRILACFGSINYSHSSSFGSGSGAELSSAFISLRNEQCPVLTKRDCECTSAPPPSAVT